MKNVKGFWLPDHEEHLIPFLEQGPRVHDGPTYQYRKLFAALHQVKRRRHAVDIGAHCGLWSRVLAHEFDRLTAFEPVPDHIACFDRNVPLNRRAKVVFYHCALGAAPGRVRLHTGPASSGDTYVAKDGEHEAEMLTLDSFGLKDVDFIKIDTEGYEHNILLGAQETVRQCRPVIIVEQKPGKGSQFGLDDHAAITLLEQWGMTKMTEMGGDFIMVWPN